MSKSGRARRAISHLSDDETVAKMGHPSGRRSREVRHYAHLDALRGLAVLGVLVVHGAWIAGVTGYASALAGVGFRGVQMFYVVSALTLYLSMDEREKERRPLRNFYVRRFFRIAPVFYLSMVGATVYRYAGLATVAPMRLAWWQHVLGSLFLHGLSPTAMNAVAMGGWSVGVECLFYAVLPLVHRYVRGLWGAVLLYAASVAMVEPLSAWCARRWPQWGEYFTVYWFPRQMPVFALGIVVYFVWRGMGRQRWWSLVALVGAAILLRPGRSTLVGDSMMVALVVLGLSLYPWRVLVNPAMVWLGKISYSVYLGHFFVFEILIWWMKGHGLLGLKMGSWEMFVAVMGLIMAGALPLAWCSWRWVERPGIAMGRRLIARSSS